MSDFNLYLYLGSYWVNTSRDTRLDMILDTIPDTKSGPELRSLDQLIELKTENRAGRKGASTQSWAESRRLRTRIAPKPVPRSLTEEGSVRGRSLQSSSSTGSTRNQDQLFVVHWDGPTRIFSKSIVSSQITGNEVFF